MSTKDLANTVTLIQECDLDDADDLVRGYLLLYDCLSKNPDQPIDDKTRRRLYHNFLKPAIACYRKAAHFRHVCGYRNYASFTLGYGRAAKSKYEIYIDLYFLCLDAAISYCSQTQLLAERDEMYSKYSKNIFTNRYTTTEIVAWHKDNPDMSMLKMPYKYIEPHPRLRQLLSLDLVPKEVW